MWVELRSISCGTPMAFCFGYMEKILPETDLQVWKWLVVEYFEESSVDVHINQYLYMLTKLSAQALLFF